MERNNRLFSNYKLIIAGVIIVALLIALIINLIPKERAITTLEEKGIKDFSAKVMPYMDEIDLTNEGPGADKLSDISTDRYIAYALEYSYNNNDKSELSATEIKDLIASIFDVELNEEKINSVGISPLLLDKHVGHEPVNMVYSIDKTNYTKRDIAAIPVSNYVLTSIKADKDDYVVTYDKFSVKNPYDALNNAKEDIPGINAYLNGNGKVAPVKAAIDGSFANKDKETVVKMKTKDSKLTITSIK